MDRPIKHWTLTQQEWYAIRNKLIEEFGLSIVLISWKLKRELGFTVREHTDFDRAKDTVLSWYERTKTIHIDFYSEEARTYFLLKYT